MGFESAIFGAQGTEPTTEPPRLSCSCSCSVNQSVSNGDDDQGLKSCEMPIWKKIPSATGNGAIYQNKCRRNEGVVDLPGALVAVGDDSRAGGEDIIFD